MSKKQKPKYEPNTVSGYPASKKCVAAVMKDVDTYQICLIHKPDHLERVLHIRTACSERMHAINVLEAYERLYSTDIELVIVALRPSESQKILRLFASYYPVRLVTEWEVAALRVADAISDVTVEALARSGMLRGVYNDS